MNFCKLVQVKFVLGETVQVLFVWFFRQVIQVWDITFNEVQQKLIVPNRTAENFYLFCLHCCSACDLIFPLFLLHSNLQIVFYNLFQNPFVAWSKHLVFNVRATSKFINAFGYTYRGSPTNTKITNTVSTTTVFGLCTCKWGNFTLVGDSLQSH